MLPVVMNLLSAIINSICDNLDLKCDVAAVMNDTSFDMMKSKSPEHVRAGKTGDWERYFEEPHKDLIKRVAGQALIDLGYENDLDW